MGDIIRVNSEEPFPADLVLLSSSEPEGLCYIETANLDGETNLKIKQALPDTSEIVSPGDLSRISGKLLSEQPNSSLYTYEATLNLDDGNSVREIPLSPDQLLLRGATLRNTQWIHGLVVLPATKPSLCVMPLLLLLSAQLSSTCLICKLFFCLPFSLSLPSFPVWAKSLRIRLTTTISDIFI